jgi:hypothetical protein
VRILREIDSLSQWEEDLCILPGVVNGSLGPLLYRNVYQLSVAEPIGVLLLYLYRAVINKLGLQGIGPFSLGLVYPPGYVVQFGSYL